MDRIISLAASVTAIIDELGRVDRLVAVTKDCARLTPSVQGLHVVGDAWSASPEELEPLEANLVIGASPYKQEVVANLIQARTRFVATAAWGLAEIYEDIRMIGRLVDASAAAEALVVRMRREIAETRAATRDLVRPSVYCEVWMRPVMSSPKWVYELLEAAGGAPVTPPAAILEASDVLAANPEVVVMAWCGAIGRSNPNEFRRREGYGGLRAVVEDRIVPVRDEFLNAPCQHLLTGLRILKHALHPGHFGPLPSELLPHLRAPATDVGGL